MPVTLALDVYDTLINVNHIALHLEKHCNGEAPAFAKAWRNKKLEYTFRRGLMRRYEPFPVCIKEALDYTCSRFGINMTADDKHELIGKLGTLPVFDDVAATLQQLHEKSVPLFALSNGLHEDVHALLKKNNIAQYFEGIVSADEIKTYKPDPELFRHFLKRAGSSVEETVFVAANPFEIAGATSCGLNTIYVKRENFDFFDPWEHKPGITVSSFSEIGNEIHSFINHKPGS